MYSPGQEFRASQIFLGAHSHSVLYLINISLERWSSEPRKFDFEIMRLLRNKMRSDNYCSKICASTFHVMM
ncbi:hypothetical protein EYC84_010618 [Monilinia fructicola]|uniref:Uncharacterized protein n=1 Tax=Monilinia fructicola TaxID=38448 RepID=A0A5M9J7N4_MONFR|nr:hypothetical protein EYC84_010618 [Monilinia fructicola]